MLTGCSSSTADTSNILNFGCTNFSDSLDPAAMPNAAWCVSRYGIGEALFRLMIKWKQTTIYVMTTQ